MIAVMGLRLGYLLARRLLGGLVLLARSDPAKVVEVLVLGHQLTVLHRHVGRPRLAWTDRAMMAALTLRVPPARRVGMLVTPGTILRWHRRLGARRWTTTNRRRPTRPSIPSGVRALVQRLAVDNPDWCYRRILGELPALGHRVAASTIWSILKAQSLDPAPRRSGPTWQQLLTAQGRGHRGLRPLRPGHHHRASAVNGLHRRARHPAGADPRRHGAPDRGVADAARPPRSDGSSGCRPPSPVLDPRSGRPVHTSVRHGPHRGRHGRDQDPGLGASGERDRRTVRGQVSYGAQDKSLIEFKLGGSSSLKRNLEKQVAIYEAANGTRSSVKAVICYTAEQQERVAKILRELKLESEESVVVIDARSDNKPSASRA
jgi:hypothetical protein